MGSAYDYDLLSIGSGPVGQRAAVQAAKLGKRTAIVARGHILGDDSGLLKMLFQRENHRLLGVHVIGTGATELIHIGQAVQYWDSAAAWTISSPQPSITRPWRNATRWRHWMRTTN
jgi:pyruvate/2-oxoglutarate dehydrogenase complex dihydrolipoamide dehydrogenase (E3) component